MPGAEDDSLDDIVAIDDCGPKIVITKHLVKDAPIFQRHAEKLTALLDVLNRDVEVVVGVLQEAVHIVHVRLQYVDDLLFALGRPLVEQVYAERDLGDELRRAG